ncbi:MAG: hypothetical protein EOO57_04455 [Hymenobacter sp.]|nr:MAG: hypothetical protein EOO57_04455 [Hymenobacter sp.]
MEKKIAVVITYKPFYFLTKICLASIRYYYPDAELYIVKDLLAGEFDTSELEQALGVKELDLGHQKYGLSAAKVHLLASNKFAGQRVLSLDCDIVLAGRFLDELYAKTEGADFVLNPDYVLQPTEAQFGQHYYDMATVKKLDPDFVYPGYVFNGGQAIIKTGIVAGELLAPFFDVDNFPYYRRRDVLPHADQSMLNYLLPKLQQEGKLTIAPVEFMWWSDGAEVKNITLEQVKAGTAYKHLIHWAGVTRVANIDQMTRPDILHFFQDFYYSKVPLGGLKKQLHMAQARADYFLRNVYRTMLKPLIKH